MVSSESWKRLYPSDDSNPYKYITFKKKLPHWRIGLSSPKKLPLPNQTWNQKSFGNHQIHKVAVSFHQSNSWCRNNFHKVQPEKYEFVKIFIQNLNNLATVWKNLTRFSDLPIHFIGDFKDKFVNFFKHFTLSNLLTHRMWQIQLWCPRSKWNMGEILAFLA